MKITVIGTGYVGLVSGACFAEFGFSVTCVDKDPKKIETLKQGRMPIYEPGLETLVAANTKAGRLHFTTDITQNLAEADAVFIAVGTPSRRGDGHADLAYVFAAVDELADLLRHETVIVTKSTVPVGTGRAIRQRLAEKRPDLEFHVASNPEFLREGSAIEDFMRPNRVVIGVTTQHAKKVLNALYRPLFLNQTPMVITGVETAELIKYAANGFLATKIAFINEVADLCEKSGADIQDVARGIGLDQRIGQKFLHPGPGYGGSCFPKDTLALKKIARDYDAPITIIESVIAANAHRKAAMGPRISAIIQKSLPNLRPILQPIPHPEGASSKALTDITIAILGLTFKPNTDDMRESPSLTLIPYLLQQGATLRVYDPKGMDEARTMLSDGDDGRMVWCDGAEHALTGADAGVVVTEWNEFRALDPAALTSLMAHPLMIDLRNIFDPKTMQEAGFDYHSVGRPQRDDNPDEIGYVPKAVHFV